MMESLLKKALLFQAEIASMASEKVQEVASTYVEKGTLHDADAKKFVSEVREKLLATSKDVEDKISKLTKMVQDMGVPGMNTGSKSSSSSSSDNVEDEIEKLEKRLEELKIKQEMAAKHAKKDN
ncbi:MAG: hypothetical protein H7263_10630 [Candidatus Sericytochromatia bacterium]|nr:hypothetical protein [Candidatus Sericytochromatia bacterium]